MHFKIPYEQLHKQKPDIFALRIFGCLCFASTLVSNRDKLDSKSRKCIFLGFKTRVKGYVVFYIKTRETFISRDVVFHESNFINLKDNAERHDDGLEQDFFYLPSEDTSDRTNLNMQLEEHEGEGDDLRRSMRSRRAPNYLKDYHHNISTSKALNIKPAKSKLKVKYPISFVLSYDNESETTSSNFFYLFSY